MAEDDTRVAVCEELLRPSSGVPGPGSAGDVDRRPSPVAVEMLDVGNRSFSHFHETAGSHFQSTCWKWQKTRRAAIFKCPSLFP